MGLETTDLDQTKYMSTPSYIGVKLTCYLGQMGSVHHLFSLFLWKLLFCFFVFFQVNPKKISYVEIFVWISGLEEKTKMFEWYVRVVSWNLTFTETLQGAFCACLNWGYMVTLWRTKKLERINEFRGLLVWEVESAFCQIVLM